MDEQPYQNRDNKNSNNGARDHDSNDLRRPEDALVSSHIAGPVEVDALLSATMPEVDARFRRELEERLISKLQARQAERVEQQAIEQPGTHQRPPTSVEQAGGARVPGRLLPTFPATAALAPARGFRHNMSRAASVAMGVVGFALLALLFVGMSALLGSRQLRGTGPDGRSLTGTPQPWITPTSASAGELSNEAFAASLQPITTTQEQLVDADSIAWSPDGRSPMLAVLGPSTIRLWDPATNGGTQITVDRAVPGRAYTGIYWSPDGKLLATRSQDGNGGGSTGGGETMLWDSASLRGVESSAIAVGAVAMAWSPDGHTLAYSDGDTVTLLRISDAGNSLPSSGQFIPAELRSTTAGGARITAIAWSSADRLAVSRGSTITIWDPDSANAKVATLQNNGKVARIAWPNGGGVLAAVVTGQAGGKNGNYIALWGITGDYRLNEWMQMTGVNAPEIHADTITSLAWSPTRSTIAVGLADVQGGKTTNERIDLYDLDLAAKSPLRTLQGRATDLAWSPDGKRLTVADASAGKLTLWAVPLGAPAASPGAVLTPTPMLVPPPPAASEGDPPAFARSLQPWARWKASQLYSGALAWSAEGGLLAVATSRDVTFRNPTTGQVRFTYKLERAGTITDIAWSSDGRVLAAMGNETIPASQPSAGASGFILLLDVSSSGSVSLLDTITSRNMLTQMAWSPDGHTLAYTDGWQVYMWDSTARPEVPKPLPTWPAPLTTHPDANTTELNAVNGLSWSPDGKRLAMSQNRAIKLTDVQSGKELLSISVQAPSRVTQVVWSPDGNRLSGVVGNDSGTRESVAMVWDATKGEVLQTISPGRPVSRVAWSSYANVLAIGTSDNTGAAFFVLYDPSTGEALNDRTAVGQAVDSLVWSHDGRTLAIGSAANETVLVFAPGSRTGPSPTLAPIEPTITPVPTGVTPIPGGPPATATEAMPEPPTPVGSGNVPDALRAAVWNLRHIEMVDENNGWGASAIGEYPNMNSVLLRTTDGARTWSNISPFAGPTGGGELIGMHFLDANVGWIVAGKANTKGVTVYRTTDGGKAWSGLPLPTRYLFVQPYAQVSLDFVDRQFGWMVVWGAGGMSYTIGQLFATEDGGITWREVASTDNSALPFGGDISFRDRSTGWLVGSQASTAPKELYITRDGGKRWVAQKLAVADSVDPLVTISVLGPPTFFSGKDAGKGAVTALVTSQNGTTTDQSTAVFITADGGSTWRGSSAVPYSYPGSSFFLDAAHWWVWSTDPMSVGPGTPVNGQLYGTTNGDAAWSGNGAIWEKVGGSADWMEKAVALGYQMSQLEFVSANVGYALLTASDTNNPGTVYILFLKSADSGKIWSLADPAQVQQPLPPTAQPGP
ncbi:MAG: hypothetical protein ABI670_17750 [Chloroflexota bacterium]